MKKDVEKNVSRETCVPAEVHKLFSRDPAFISSFRLLEERGEITCNTSSPGFILFWLRAAADLGYLPVVLFDRERDAEAFYADALAFFHDDLLAWIPLFDSDTSVYRRSALENHLARFLSNLYNNSVELIISSNAIFEKTVTDRKTLRKNLFTLNPGLVISYSDLADRLADLGYVRSDMVEHCGEYAIRGGIVDIYPFGETYPLRLEFFGNTLESMRRFNPNDQISFEDCGRAVVPPASSSVFSKTRLRDILPEHTLLIRIVPTMGKVAESVPDLNEIKLPFKRVLFCESSADPDVAFITAPCVAPSDIRDHTYYDEILKQYQHILVFSEYDILRESLREYLGSRAIFIRAHMKNGFQYKPLRLVCLSGRELFHKEHYVNPDKRFIPEHAVRIDAPESLRYGDAVVHVDYGIGIYRGVERLTFRGSEQEAMVVEYKNKDKVFVPIRYMNKIFRYSNEDIKGIPLDRIGSNLWEQTKNATRRYVREAAFDLLSLYRDRKKLPGFAFFKNTPDATRLESMFPYTETSDQLSAIRDINR
ncbi:MAG: hypothetical protein K0B52_05480, partial [FCB group bacterium]|nr:hypothetical protein [FCB group bacterium]